MMLPKDPEYRNRKLLDLAHAMRCQCPTENCYCSEAAEPAHSNDMQHGKGRSRKAHDCFFAALGHDCHVELDQGTGWSPAAKRAFWREAWRRTFTQLYFDRKIVLPVLTVDDAKDLGGGVLLIPEGCDQFVAYPNTVADQAWLEFWRQGLARVAA